MRVLDEEGSPLELGPCRQLGYYRVCGEEMLLEPPYASLAFYLRLLSRCAGSLQCANAVPASGQLGPAKRLGQATFQRMVNAQVIDASLETSHGQTLYLSLTQPYGSRLFLRGYQGGLFDLASHRPGVTLAVRGMGRSGSPLYLPRLEPPPPLEEIDRVAAKHLPLLYMVSYELVNAYLQAENASLLLAPPSPSYCSRGFRIDCYAYHGPSTCIYSTRSGGPIKCPLRPLTRRGRKTLGGAFHVLKRAQDRAEKLRRHLPQGPQGSLDLFLTCFLIRHLSHEVLDLALANTRILGGRTEPIVELYSQLGLGECTPPPAPHPRLRELAGELERRREERDLSNPYRVRTDLIRSLARLPHVLEVMADMVEAGQLYKYCRPTPLRPGQRDSLRAYLRREYPLLGASTIDAIVERIARSLEHYGCVEPRDLEPPLDRETAAGILDYLVRRSILSRHTAGGQRVYNPTRYLEDFL